MLEKPLRQYIKNDVIYVFIDYAKDSTLNRIYSKMKYHVRVGNPCYFRLSNRKESVIRENASHYLFVDSLNIAISENNI